jgi:hypothetical protein
MQLTTSRYYTAYIVNNVDTRIVIERSDVDLKQWNLVIDDLGMYIKVDSKKEALQYVQDLIHDNQIQLV